MGSSALAALMQHVNICDDQRWPWWYLDHIILIECYIYSPSRAEMFCETSMEEKKTTTADINHQIVGGIKV